MDMRPVSQESKEKLGRETAVPERRRHQRKKVRCFVVFKHLNDAKKDADISGIGYTRDVSGCGMYFWTVSQPSAGDRISMTVHLTSDWSGGGGIPPTLDAAGKILRVEQSRGGIPALDFNGVAIQFDDDIAVNV
ncbi:MAG: hypothetical protein C4532_01075 [Candidatus Abyssobacteria bacterium SURF_17]|uniref:PilZ domain-containing protein n=1 Tax=Candidatus Abyssobacteria bacterium SURF_17 TaxID=2093361 RepID=A0A419F907_9BACT|nr:MAG: hypothetical protein C4532_01075 [Candidatus Abyssubacteria bacterium SURF_17]